MESLVSIIIPAFNEEKNIGRCLESLIAQTYQNIEILVIDDGSTDGTNRICRGYILSDERIKIIEVPNGGVSKARNIGLENIKGKYFTFVDADDIVTDIFIELMITQMIAYNIDLAVCGIEETGDRTGIKQSSYPDGKYVISNTYDVLADLLISTLLNSNWNKIYKNDSKVGRFDERLLAGEDLDFNLQYLKNVTSVVLINRPLYKYKIDKKSGIKTLYNRINFDDYNLVWKKVFEFFDGKISETYHREILYKYIAELQGCFLTALVNNNLNPVKTVKIYKFYLRNGMVKEALAGITSKEKECVWIKWNYHGNYYMLLILQYGKYFRNFLRLKRK